jgi:hypothetical protein
LSIRDDLKSYQYNSNYHPTLNYNHIYRLRRPMISLSLLHRRCRCCRVFRWVVSLEERCGICCGVWACRSWWSPSELTRWMAACWSTWSAFRISST